MSGSIIPWGKKKEQEQEEKPSTAVAVREERKSDIAIYKGNPLAPARTGNNALVQVRSKELMVAGKKRKVDPYQLIRIIKRVTQNIGEYKGYEDVYSSVIVGALRKARGDLVNILEDEFHIHWQINADTGESVFYM